MRRQWWVTLLVLVGMLSAGSIAMAQGTEIVFWHGYGDSSPEGRAFKAVVDRFNETHPGIVVRTEVKDQGGTFFDGYLTSLIGGVSPDVMWIERSIVSSWAREGLLRSLGDPDRAGKSGFLPGPFGEVEWQGQVWGIPWNTDARGLYWNIDMLNSAGFDGDRGPETWSDLNDWSLGLTRREGDQLAQVGLVPWSGNWFFPAWVWTFGGELYDEATRRATFVSPQVIEAIEWMASYHNYFTNDEISAFESGGDSFTAGKKAFLVEGNWSVSWIEPSGVNFGVGRVPHPETGHNGTWGGGFAIAIPTGAAHVAEAEVFTRWLGTQEAQSIFAEIASTLPTQIDAVRAFADSMPPKWHAFYNQINEANSRYKDVWIPVLQATLPVRNGIFAGEAPGNIAERVQVEVQASIDALFAK